MLALLPSGLWAVDEFHPVAAVLDPETGAARRVVSWSQVPMPGPKDVFAPLPIVKSDGTGLWVQYDMQGPLASIDKDGLRAAVWTDGLELVACGPDVSWCTAWVNTGEPQQGDRPWASRGRLLRVDRDGRTTAVSTPGRIDQIRSGSEALFVQMYVPPTGSAGAGTPHPTRWVSLPWDDEVPGELTAAGQGEKVVDEPDRDPWENLAWDGVGQRHFFSSYWPPYLPSDVTTDHHRWSLGSSQDPPQHEPNRRRLLGTAHTPDGTEIQRWDLGRGGGILSATALGDRLAVTVARPGGASEVLALDPDTSEARGLLAPDAVRITDLGWPMVTRPVAADSYVEQLHARWSRLEFGEGQLSDVRASLLGQWPDTQLEWTFRWPTRPGLVLRRRVPLFDELGRIADNDAATQDLMESMEGGGLPPAEDAVDGYLDL